MVRHIRLRALLCLLVFASSAALRSPSIMNSIAGIRNVGVLVNKDLSPSLRNSLGGLQVSALPVYQTGLAVNSAIATASLALKQNLLTPAGLLHSWALGVSLWGLAGPRGWVVGVAYLILGSAVTKYRINEKKRLGIAEKRSGARGPENVWGSAATGVLCAATGYAFPSIHTTCNVGFIASMATKLADTFSSEIGKAIGKTTFLVTSFDRVPRGTEGAISVEGTVAGVIGALIISVLGAGLQIIGVKHILPCMSAAFLANIAESYLGATCQGKVSWLTNDSVNFINTLIGALLAMTLVNI